MFRYLAALLALVAAPVAAQVKLQPPNTLNAQGQIYPVAPVYSLPYEDAVVLAGRGYTVSTGVMAVSSGNVMTVELANPAGSGVNFVLTARVFSNNVIGGAAPLEYQRFGQDAVYPASASITPTIGNRIAGGPASPGTFRYTMGAAGPTGTITSSGFIPTNGEEKRIKDIVILAPGTRLVYQISGAGGGLAAAARVAFTVLYFTTPA